jgi:hypothetical protein
MQKVKTYLNKKTGKRCLGVVGAPHGVRNGNSRLTEAEVRKLRELLATKTYSYAALGKMFGVSAVHVSKIANGLARRRG